MLIPQVSLSGDEHLIVAFSNITQRGCMDMIQASDGGFYLACQPTLVELDVKGQVMNKCQIPNSSTAWSITWNSDQHILYVVVQSDIDATVWLYTITPHTNSNSSCTFSALVQL